MSTKREKGLLVDGADLLATIWKYGNACAEERSPSPEMTWPEGYWSEQCKEIANEIVDRVERLVQEAQKRR